MFTDYLIWGVFYLDEAWFGVWFGRRWYNLLTFGWAEDSIDYYSGDFRDIIHEGSSVGIVIVQDFKEKLRSLHHSPSV